jgi:hypothetical protein
VEFQDQSSSELVLNIIPFNKDISELTVLSTDSIQNDLFDVEYGIIGASHFVKVTNKNTNETFMEVFACITLEYENIISINASKINDFMRTGLNGFVYNFSSEIVTSDDDNFQDKFNNEIEKSKRGLSYIFPKRDEDTFDPLTTITVILEGDAVNISTMHAYPNEKTITLTNSKIKGN